MQASLAQHEPGRGAQRNQPGREEAEKPPTGLSLRGCRAPVLSPVRYLDIKAQVEPHRARLGAQVSEVWQGTLRDVVHIVSKGWG